MDQDVRAHGAAGDGTTLDHGAIQAAIDRCHADGGGTVSVPEGRYLCGAIRMRSNVRLFLAKGAALLAAQQPDLYPAIRTTPGGKRPGAARALLWAADAENVVVAGPGEINGQVTGRYIKPTSAPPFRAKLAFLRDCRDVRFEDMTFRNADSWTLHLLRCDTVVVRGIRILNDIEHINSDGIDPDGCTNVTIRDCHIVAGDDCIVIKSTQGDPCENVAVSNCVLSTKCAALKIGTEGIGDIRNVTFENCVITDTRMALALYQKDGSTYENIVFSNITIQAWGDFPIFVDVTPRDCRKPTKGVIRNLVFENIDIAAAGRCYVEGLPDRPIRNLVFRNVAWAVNGPCRVEGLVKPGGTSQRVSDPDRVNYAERPYHFIGVHVGDMTVDGFRLLDRRRGTAPDRGLFFLHGVERSRFRGVEPIDVPDDLPPVVTEACRDLTMCGPGLEPSPDD